MQRLDATNLQHSNFQPSAKRSPLYTRFLAVRSVHPRAYIVKRSHSQ